MNTGLSEVNEAKFTTTVNAPRITIDGADIEETFAKRADLTADYVSKTEVDDIVANAIIDSESASNITLAEAIEAIKYLEGRIKILESLMSQLGFDANMAVIKAALNVFQIPNDTDVAFGF